MTVLSLNSKLFTDSLASLPAPSAPVKSAGEGDGTFAQTVQDAIDRVNAPILEKRSQQKKQAAVETKRILEVGFAQYKQEQLQIQKMMKLLKMLAAKAEMEEKQFLEQTIEHFEDNPPETVSDITDYMDASVSSLADGPLKDKLSDLLDVIQEMYNTMTDEELDRMKDELNI